MRMFLAIRPYQEMVLTLVGLMHDTKLNCFRDKAEEAVLTKLRFSSISTSLPYCLLSFFLSLSLRFFFLFLSLFSPHSLNLSSFFLSTLNIHLFAHSLAVIHLESRTDSSDLGSSLTRATAMRRA